MDFLIFFFAFNTLYMYNWNPLYEYFGKLETPHNAAFYQAML